MRMKVKRKRKMKMKNEKREERKRSVEVLKSVIIDGRSQWKATGITIGFVSSGIIWMTVVPNRVANVVTSRTRNRRRDKIDE